MPVTFAEVDQYKKGLTDEQKRKWLAIYNRVFEACKAAGVQDEEECHVKALRIASSRVDEADTRTDAVSQRPWGEIKESDYTIEQLARAVPKAVLAWAKAQAKKEGRDLIKADLKLRYKNPDGTVNINGIRAAKQRLPRTKLPADVLKKAEAELEAALKRAKKELGIADRTDGAQHRESYGAVRVVRYDEEAGLLVVDAPIAKMTVLPYLDESGRVVHELKHPRDFASPAFLDTIPGKPIVNGHAPGGVPFDLLDEDARARYMCGMFHTAPGSVWVEDDKIWAREIIFDQELIDEIRSGKKAQVSTGIWSVVVDEEGVYDGKRYERRQTRPTLDHLAHVERGRCGPDCAVVLDGAMEVAEDDGKDQDAGGNNMADNDPKGMEQAQDQAQTQAQVQDEALTLKLDDLSIALSPDAVEDEIKAFQAKIDELLTAKAEAEKKIDKLQKALDAAKGEGDGKDAVIKALQDELKGLQELQSKLDEGLDERLDERIDMIAFMREIDPDYDHHGKSVADMRVDALKTFDEKFDPEGLSEDYVKARFDTVREFWEKQKKDPTGTFNLRAPRGDEADDNEAQKQAEARTLGLYRDPRKKPGKTE